MQECGAYPCRLCTAVGPLRKSHILPEFGFSDLYDSRHRFYRLGGVDGVDYMQKGLRERLLCDLCEKRLNVYETYVSSVLRLMPLPVARKLMIHHVEYERFKLFELSLLWRVHASRDPLFRQVNLGPHAERVRKMLLNGDPGASTDYPCGLFVLRFEGEQRRDFINAWLYRQGAHHGYALIFAGFAWSFVVSNHSQQHAVADIALREDGRLAVGAFEMERSDGLGRFASDLLRANQAGIERLRAAHERATAR